MAPVRIRGFPPILMMMGLALALLGAREYFALRTRLGSQLETAQNTIAELRAQLQQSKRSSGDCHSQSLSLDSKAKQAAADLEGCQAQRTGLAQQLKAAEQQLKDLQQQQQPGDGGKPSSEQLAAAEKAGREAATTALTTRLQASSLGFLRIRFGKGPVRIRFELRKEGTLVVETAPFEVMPHSLYHYLTLVDAGFYDGCAFVRNAGHVMQGNCYGTKPCPQLVFQEYSPDYVHHPFTLGLAGRPAAADFYVNLVDNIRNHGPGGQGGTESDPCFAKLVEGREIIERLHGRLDNEWLPKDQFVVIEKATIERLSSQA